MKLLMIAQKNLKKNFTFYSLYLFSVSFVLMVFFSFVSFAMNDVIMERISSDGRVETMSRVITIFVMGFVLFYMSYSNTFFMKRRMRELGIYALLGYRKSSMLQLLTFENIFICFGSLVVGIFMGSFVHKGIVAGIVHLLDLQIDNSKIPFLNLKAIALSSLFVLAVLLVLLLSNWNLLRKKSLLTLVRLEKSGEKQIKLKLSLAVLGLLLLLFSYGLASDITRGKNSLWFTIGFSPIALLTLISVVVGTIFFIHSFLPYIILKIKKRKGYFYQETNIITIPKFIYRIRSNAKTLILLTLLSAGTLAILGSTILSIYYPITALSRVIPSAIEFPIKTPMQAEQAVNIVGNIVGKENIKFRETSLIKVTSSSKNLPFEYSTREKNGFDLISESDYRELIQLQNKKISLEKLDDNECILVKYRYDKINTDKGNKYTLNFTSDKNINITVKNTTLMNPIGFTNSMGTLIISDRLYDKVAKLRLPVTDIMSIDGKNMRENKEVYEQLVPLLKDNIYFASAYQRNAEYIHENSSTLLLITFVTIIFFIATGSILYFHNISSMTYDKSDFIILKKMGYSREKIQQIIKKQVFILFSIPYVLGVIHSLFALECYKFALMDNLLGKNSTFLLTLLISIGIFTIVYIIYFVITKRACYQIVFKDTNMPSTIV